MDVTHLIERSQARYDAEMIQRLTPSVKIFTYHNKYYIIDTYNYYSQFKQTE